MGSPGTVSLYNNAVESIGDQTDDWVNDNHRMALLTSSHSYTASHATWSQISANEVTGTGYTAGGAALANESVNTATDGTAKFLSDDVSWTGSTITARWAACVKWNGVTVQGTDELIFTVQLDTTQDVSSTNGTFKIQDSADGWFTLS